MAGDCCVTGDLCIHSLSPAPYPPTPSSSVLCHASASCTRSVGANAALLLWDSFQPQDGVSLRSVRVFVTGCVLHSA